MLAITKELRDIFLENINIFINYTLKKILHYPKLYKIKISSDGLYTIIKQFAFKLYERV